MNRLHIIGRKNHGKTTLVVDLLRELTGRGLVVGAVKHTHHDHELDRPGKDSFRHRQAGAAPAAVLARRMTAVFLPHGEQADRYGALAPFYAGCDLVIVEGDLEARATKIEVWRSQTEAPPLALERDDIAAVVTDDPLELTIPVWPRRDVALVADRILDLMRKRAGEPS